MAKWNVHGWDHKKGPIKDTVQGASNTDEAMEKARKKYPNAPELGVSGMSAKETELNKKTESEPIAKEPTGNPFIDKYGKGAT